MTKITIHGNIVINEKNDLTLWKIALEKVFKTKFNYSYNKIKDEFILVESR